MDEETKTHLKTKLLKAQIILEELSLAFDKLPSEESSNQQTDDKNGKEAAVTDTSFMNATKIRRAKDIPILLVERLYWAAIHFRDFIEMQPLDTPVLWIGDRKTKVTDMQPYKVSCESVKVFESYVNSETMDACELLNSGTQMGETNGLIEPVTIKTGN